MPSAAKYILELAAAGRHHFSTNEAVAALGGCVPTVRAALRRLKVKGEIADPYRGFYVIVPPECRRLGCLPADQFVSQLMQHLGEAYYVALLSAAELHAAETHGAELHGVELHGVELHGVELHGVELHGAELRGAERDGAELDGAALQRPRVFQVMVNANRRALQCGEVRVQFVASKNLERTPVIEKPTPRGLLRVSSPEATALELVGHADLCGGLDNVASVVSGLVAAIDPPKLIAAAALCPIAWVQRLGYLLDVGGHRELADVLVPHVKENARRVAPLVRANTKRGAERIERWKLAVNSSHMAMPATPIRSPPRCAR